MWQMIGYINITSETSFKLMCLYLPICQNDPNYLSHIYNLQYLLYIVNSCVCMCPCDPMWPMVWYKSKTFETVCSFWTHVSLHAHVANYLRLSYDLQYWLSMAKSWVCKCLCASICPMVWYTTINSETGFSLWTYVSVSVHVPSCEQWFKKRPQPPILLSLVKVCVHVPPYGQYFLSIANTCIYVPMSPMCPKVRYTAITSCYCKLMCLHVPMCLPMTNGLGHSYFHLPQFAIVIAFSIMCLRSPL